jgi:hypothetical protein
MTQASKHGRSLKMARAISRRKYKAGQKRKNAAKYAARTEARPAPSGIAPATSQSQRV